MPVPVGAMVPGPPVPMPVISPCPGVPAKAAGKIRLVSYTASFVSISPPFRAKYGDYFMFDNGASLNNFSNYTKETLIDRTNMCMNSLYDADIIFLRELTNDHTYDQIPNIYKTPTYITLYTTIAYACRGVNLVNCIIVKNALFNFTGFHYCGMINLERDDIQFGWYLLQSRNDGSYLLVINAIGYAYSHYRVAAVDYRSFLNQLNDKLLISIDETCKDDYTTTEFSKKLVGARVILSITYAFNDYRPIEFFGKNTPRGIYIPYIRMSANITSSVGQVIDTNTGNTYPGSTFTLIFINGGYDSLPDSIISLITAAASPISLFLPVYTDISEKNVPILKCNPMVPVPHEFKVTFFKSVDEDLDNLAPGATHFIDGVTPLGIYTKGNGSLCSHNLITCLKKKVSNVDIFCGLHYRKKSFEDVSSLFDGWIESYNMFAGKSYSFRIWYKKSDYNVLAYYNEFDAGQIPVLMVLFEKRSNKVPFLFACSEYYRSFNGNESAVQHWANLHNRIAAKLDFMKDTRSQRFDYSKYRAHNIRMIFCTLYDDDYIAPTKNWSTLFMSGKNSKLETINTNILQAKILTESHMMIYDTEKPIKKVNLITNMIFPCSNYAGITASLEQITMELNDCINVPKAAGTFRILSASFAEDARNEQVSNNTRFLTDGHDIKGMNINTMRNNIRDCIRIADPDIIFLKGHSRLYSCNLGPKYIRIQKQYTINAAIVGTYASTILVDSTHINWKASNDDGVISSMITGTPIVTMAWLQWHNQNILAISVFAYRELPPGAPKAKTKEELVNEIVTTINALATTGISDGVNTYNMTDPGFVHALTTGRIIVSLSVNVDLGELNEFGIDLFGMNITDPLRRVSYKSTSIYDSPGSVRDPITGALIPNRYDHILDSIGTDNIGVFVPKHPVGYHCIVYTDATIPKSADSIPKKDPIAIRVLAVKTVDYDIYKYYRRNGFVAAGYNLLPLFQQNTTVQQLIDPAINSANITSSMASYINSCDIIFMKNIDGTVVNTYGISPAMFKSVKREVTGSKYTHGINNYEGCTDFIHLRNTFEILATNDMAAPVPDKRFHILYAFLRMVADHNKKLIVISLRIGGPESPAKHLQNALQLALNINALTAECKKILRHGRIIMSISYMDNAFTMPQTIAIPSLELGFTIGTELVYRTVGHSEKVNYPMGSTINTNTGTPTGEYLDYIYDSEYTQNVNVVEPIFPSSDRYLLLADLVPLKDIISIIPNIGKLRVIFFKHRQYESSNPKANSWISGEYMDIPSLILDNNKVANILKYYEDVHFYMYSGMTTDITGYFFNASKYKKIDTIYTINGKRYDTNIFYDKSKYEILKYKTLELKSEMYVTMISNLPCVSFCIFKKISNNDPVFIINAIVWERHTYDIVNNIPDIHTCITKLNIVMQSRMQSLVNMAGTANNKHECAKSLVEALSKYRIIMGFSFNVELGDPKGFHLELFGYNITAGLASYHIPKRTVGYSKVVVYPDGTKRDLQRGGFQTRDRQDHIFDSELTKNIKLIDTVPYLVSDHYPIIADLEIRDDVMSCDITKKTDLNSLRVLSYTMALADISINNTKLITGQPTGILITKVRNLIVGDIYRCLSKIEDIDIVFFRNHDAMNIDELIDSYDQFKLAVQQLHYGGINFYSIVGFNENKYERLAKKKIPSLDIRINDTINMHWLLIKSKTSIDDYILLVNIQGYNHLTGRALDMDVSKFIDLIKNESLKMFKGSEIKIYSSPPYMTDIRHLVDVLQRCRIIAAVSFTDALRLNIEAFSIELFGGYIDGTYIRTRIVSSIENIEKKRGGTLVNLNTGEVKSIIADCILDSNIARNVSRVQPTIASDHLPIVSDLVKTYRQCDYVLKPHGRKQEDNIRFMTINTVFDDAKTPIENTLNLERAANIDACIERAGGISGIDIAYVTGLNFTTMDEPSALKYFRTNKYHSTLTYVKTYRKYTKANHIYYDRTKYTLVGKPYEVPHTVNIGKYHGKVRLRIPITTAMLLDTFGRYILVIGADYQHNIPDPDLISSKIDKIDISAYIATLNHKISLHLKSMIIKRQITMSIIRRCQIILSLSFDQDIPETLPERKMFIFGREGIPQRFVRFSKNNKFNVNTGAFIKDNGNYRGLVKPGHGNRIYCDSILDKVHIMYPVYPALKSCPIFIDMELNPVSCFPVIPKPANRCRILHCVTPLEDVHPTSVTTFAPNRMDGQPLGAFHPADTYRDNLGECLDKYASSVDIAVFRHADYGNEVNALPSYTNSADFGLLTGASIQNGALIGYPPVILYRKSVYDMDFHITNGPSVNITPPSVTMPMDIVLLKQKSNKGYILLIAVQGYNMQGYNGKSFFDSIMDRFYDTINGNANAAQEGTLSLILNQPYCQIALTVSMDNNNADLAIAGTYGIQITDGRVTATGTIFPATSININNITRSNLPTSTYRNLDTGAEILNERYDHIMVGQFLGYMVRRLEPDRQSSYRYPIIADFPESAGLPPPPPPPVNSWKIDIHGYPKVNQYYDTTIRRYKTITPKNLGAAKAFLPAPNQLIINFNNPAANAWDATLQNYLVATKTALVARTPPTPPGLTTIQVNQIGAGHLLADLTTATTDGKFAYGGPVRDITNIAVADQYIASAIYAIYSIRDVRCICGNAIGLANLVGTAYLGPEFIGLAGALSGMMGTTVGTEDMPYINGNINLADVDYSGVTSDGLVQGPYPGRIVAAFLARVSYAVNTLNTNYYTGAVAYPNPAVTRMMAGGNRAMDSYELDLYHYVLPFYKITEYHYLDNSLTRHETDLHETLFVGGLNPVNFRLTEFGYMHGVNLVVPRQATDNGVVFDINDIAGAVHRMFMSEHTEYITPKTATNRAAPIGNPIDKIPVTKKVKWIFRYPKVMVIHLNEPKSIAPADTHIMLPYDYSANFNILDRINYWVSILYNTRHYVYLLNSVIFTIHDTTKLSHDYVDRCLVLSLTTLANQNLTYTVYYPQIAALPRIYATAPIDCTVNPYLLGSALTVTLQVAGVILPTEKILPSVLLYVRTTEVSNATTDPNRPNVLE